MAGCGDLVDPFLGTEAVDLPEPEGIAATWYYLKAQVANNHPGAALPLGPVSALPYSGAYPTGYGRYDINSHGTPPRLYDRKSAYGVTHVHHTGTGYINYFYNHLLVIPFAGRPVSVPEADFAGAAPHPLVQERAQPGWYAGRLENLGVGFELTVAQHAAAHRYRFPDVGMRGFAVDVTSGGLAPPRAQCRPREAAVRIEGDGLVSGAFSFFGVRWFFALVVRGATAAVLWHGAGASVRERPGDRALALDAERCRRERAGALYRSGADTAELYVGLSLDGPATARSYAAAAAAAGFDAVHAEARAVWDRHLSRLRISTDSEPERRIFTTALYRSLLKPARSEHSNFLWRGGPALYADFATMWDQYKTQLPLLFTLCPEHVGGIVASLRAVTERTGDFPPAVLFADDFERFSNQSRLLAFVVLRDAFDRADPARMGGAGRERWCGLLQAMVAALPRAAARVRPEEETNGHSHLLDIACAAHCASGIARGLDRPAEAEQASRFLDLWRVAFDPATGMMRRGQYYEASHTHYSFRLLPAMGERIRLAGGPAQFVQKLDRFFGYGAAPVEQLREPPWDVARGRGMALGRFDGVNNEVMLETPYAYHYAGRPDRTAEIVRAVMRHHFADSPGGLPGNDDSGALSAWYVWNTVGLFPVPGQGIFLLGSPTVERAELATGDGPLTISTAADGPGAIYLQDVRLNDQALDRAWLRYDEVLGGGRLDLRLGSDPARFRPPILPPGS